MKPLSHSWSMIAIFLLSACGGIGKAPSAPVPVTKTSIATQTTDNLAVELLTDTRLETGMTPVYLKVTTSTGEAVTDAAVTFTPMMAMSTGVNHTCPVMGTPTMGTDGLYRVDVVFLMASTDVDTWSATVGITRPGADTVQLAFPLLTVADSGRVKMFTYTDPASSVATKYITSLNFVNPPKVGLNPIVFTVHFRQDMMTFPSVDDALLALDPEMPSMGHGSPGSVDPTLTAPGRYEGQLSFSMAGEWQTTVTMSRAGIPVGAPVFATTF